MKAYEDGYTRQTVRLNLDAAINTINTESQEEASSQSVLKAGLPLVRSFAKKLWGGEGLKTIKTSIVDGEVSTLVYRVAENPLMDTALFFLPSRDLVASDKMLNFFKGMGPRPVVMVNTEQAIGNWKVENRGQEFYMTSEPDAGRKVVNLFELQSYYYYQSPLNNWQTVFFRTYPHPWEVYIEDLNYELVKVGESLFKPDYDQVVQWQIEYEDKNDVPMVKKIAKILKDASGPPGSGAVEAARAAAELQMPQPSKEVSTPPSPSRAVPPGNAVTM